MADLKGFYNVEELEEKLYNGEISRKEFIERMTMLQKSTLPIAWSRKRRPIRKDWTDYFELRIDNCIYGSPRHRLVDDGNFL